jgi:hypothetical protein
MCVAYGEVNAKHDMLFLGILPPDMMAYDPATVNAVKYGAGLVLIVIVSAIGLFFDSF